MSATLNQRIDSAILKAGTVDYLDVWFITGLVADAAGVDAESEALDLAVDAIGRLVRSGKLLAGDLRPPGEFVAWPQDSEAALERVRARLRRLERPVSVGDVAWFKVVE